MLCVTLRALVASFILLPAANLALAQNTATTTTTVTSITTVLTITKTISASTYQSVTTETTAIGGDSSSPTSSASATATGTMSYAGLAFQATVLNSTNYYRAQHQASALTWDNELSVYAQDYAKKCLWQHSHGPYGENLAEGYATPVLAIDAWANEEKKYDYEKPKFSESTGHYTQLVWKNTTAVGCGAVQCSNDASNGVQGWYLVCEYSPAGNVAGQFRQEVSKSGEGSDGDPGFGAASSPRNGSRMVVALVAAYVLLAVCV